MFGVIIFSKITKLNFRKQRVKGRKFVLYSSEGYETQVFFSEIVDYLKMIGLTEFFQGIKDFFYISNIMFKYQHFIG